MRKTWLTLLTAGVMAMTMTLPNALAQGDVKVVYVKNNQIFVASRSNDPGRQVTETSAAKSLPVWSKDGSRIAFLEGADDDASLGRIVVIAGDGQVLQRLPLKSTLGGMRFVEGLEWLAPNRLALSGSVNPSLTETAVLDLAAPAGQDNVFDDGPGADFSPDGQHFAYASGSPHFTPQSKREPALNVDHVRVYPERGVHVDFVSDRRWSPDGQRLAVVAEDFLTKRQSLVVWSRDGGISETALPLPEGSTPGLFWNASDVIIATGQGNLRITPGVRKAASAAPEALDPYQKARSERGRLREGVKRLGGEMADFWCSNCALAASPRRATSE
jgi:WD40 repeat protein